MRHRNRTVIGSPERVVRQHVPEHHSIDVALLVAIQDFPDDLQLARNDDAVDHQLEQRLANPGCRRTGAEHVLERVDRCEFDVCVCRRLDADANVEPAVAIDDVVAALAREHVAAAAAQEDVAAREDLLDIIAPVGPVHALEHQVVSDDLVKTSDAGATSEIEFVTEEQRTRGSSDIARSVCVRVIKPVVADQDVVELPTRSGFHLVVAVAKDVRLFRGEDRDAHVDVSGRLDAFVDDPVEAELAFAADHALTVNHDVVAGLAVMVVLFRAREHDVVADDLRVEVEFRVVASRGVETSAAFKPVITLVTDQQVNRDAAEHEIVALAGEHFRIVHADENRVLAGTAHQDVDTVRVGDDVIALVAL